MTDRISAASHHPCPLVSANHASSSVVSYTVGTGLIARRCASNALPLAGSTGSANPLTYRLSRPRSICWRSIARPQRRSVPDPAVAARRRRRGAPTKRCTALTMSVRVELGHRGRIPKIGQCQKQTHAGRQHPRLAKSAAISFANSLKSPKLVERPSRCPKSILEFSLRSIVPSRGSRFATLREYRSRR